MCDEFLDKNEFDIEQLKIIEERIKSRENTKGREYNRFRGDAITKIVSYYLTKHLSNDFKIVRLSWIQDCPTEFDLLIVDKVAKPINFTSAYPKNKIHLAVEVKGSGFFFGKSDVKEKVNELFDKWNKNTGKPILYLSLWERENYVKPIIEAIGKEEVFILQINKEINYGDWKRFVKRVKFYLKSDLQ